MWTHISRTEVRRIPTAVQCTGRIRRHAEHCRPHLRTRHPLCSWRQPCSFQYTWKGVQTASLTRTFVFAVLSALGFRFLASLPLLHLGFTVLRHICAADVLHSQGS